jgi:hypothetical protein
LEKIAGILDAALQIWLQGLFCESLGSSASLVPIFIFPQATAGIEACSVIRRASPCRLISTREAQFDSYQPSAGDGGVTHSSEISKKGERQ